jgi:hypothetical protein
MNPNDFGNTDQASLLQAIQAYAAMLAQQKQANDEMGVNPQIIQGQSNVDQARVQAAQGLLDAPAVAPGQNWEVDPNGANNMMAKKLMEQGAPAMVAPRQQASYGNPLMDMLRPTDWETAGFNKNVRAQYDNDLARARNNGETRMLTPQEMQARDIAMKQAPLDAATGLLGGTKPQQAFDPAQLQAGLPGMQAVAVGAQGSRNAFMQADGQVRSAALAAQGQIGAAKATAEGNVAAERAKLEGKDAELSKSTKGAMEMQVIDAEAMQTSLQTLGKDFTPDYFNDISLTKNDLAQWAERKGVDMSVAQEEYTRGRTQFILNTKQMFNAYRKSITGAAASEKELADLEASLFNTKMSPTAAKAALLDLMTNIQLKSFIAKNALEKGIMPKGIKPRSKEFGDYIDSVAGAGDYSKMKEAIRAYYLQQNPALNPNPVPAKPVTERVYNSMERGTAAAKLQARAQQRQQQGQ